MIPRTTILQKLALIAGALVCILLLLEGGLRAAGFLLLFLRDRSNLAQAGKSGEIRIMCVGESTTFYGGSNAYPRQLEEVLNTLGAPRRFTIINKGRPGTNTNTVVQNLESWIDQNHPDAVVAMIGINDVGMLAVTPLPEEGGAGERFVKNLRLYKLFTLILEGARRMGGGAAPDSLLDADELAASLREEAEKKPGDAAGYLKLGQVLLEREHFAQAQEAFRKAAEITPSAGAFFGLAMSLKKAASFEKAIEAFKSCLAIDPKNDRAWAEGGEVYSMKRNKNRGEAEKMFARAIELNPDNDLALAGMAYCIWKKKIYQEAIGMGERAVAANPQNKWAYEIMSSCWKKLHDIPAAIRTYEREIAHNPRASFPHAELGRLYAQVGDTTRAEEQARQAREIGLDMYKPVTRKNYQRIREILAKRRVRLVAMQYPVRSIEPLQRLLEPNEGVVFVDNEGIFREALQRLSTKELFTDLFGGDFGHCTPAGNRLIADNLARVLLSEVFPALPAGASAVTH
jgi:tetratricopeptide (TPR) repeat protein